MDKMRARTEFENSIVELNYLIDSAREDNEHDKVYYKSIVLLLCAKLERFVKDSTKEYIKELLNLGLPCEKIPDSFLKEIIKNEVEKINKISVEKYMSDESHKTGAKVFSALWNKKYILKSLDDVDFVVSISNNGTTAFADTYKKIGFPEIIKSLRDYTHKTEVEGVETSTIYSISEKINKVIWLRHNIIHDDATPPITISDILIYMDVFKDFVKQIDEALCGEIGKLKEVA